MEKMSRSIKEEDIGNEKGRRRKKEEVKEEGTVDERSGSTEEKEKERGR